MSGDSDNEFESVGETPAPHPAEPKAEGPERVTRRSFRAWESAQREESALSKLGKRISGMFAKRPSQQAAPVEASTHVDEAARVEEPGQSSELELIMPEPAPELESVPETADETSSPEPAKAEIDPAFYVPPEVAEQLGVPQQSEEPAAEPRTFDVVPEGEPIHAADVVPEVEDIVPEAVEPPKRPGFFARLFGRKSKAEPEQPEIESFEIEKDESAGLEPAALDEEPLISTAEHQDAQLEETLEPMAAESPPEQRAGDAPEPVSEVEMPIAEAEAPVVQEAAFGEPPTVPMDELPPPIEEPTTAPMPESRGLFGRFFSRKPKVSRPIPIERTDAVEPTLEETPAVETPVEEMPALEAPVEEMPKLETPALESAEPVAGDEELTRTDEHATVPDELTAELIEPPRQEEAPVFASVEDALPAEPEPSTVDLIEAALAEPIAEPEKKPGFFSRLFGRKSKPEPRPSLEIEFHEDRVEAAAHALDDVSGESFAGATAETADPYASVDEALPTEESGVGSWESGARPTDAEPTDVEPADVELPTRDSELPTPVEDVSTLEVPAIPPEDLRFAPPVQEPASVASSSDLVIEPFDPFAETLDPNRESEADSSLPQARAGDEPSPEELELEAELGLRPSGGDVTERKTDEFEVVSVDTEATTGEILEPAAAQAAKLTWWMRLLGRKASVEAKAGVPAGATVVEGKPDFLFSKFKAFYGEIIRFKHQKTEFAAGFSTAILTDFNADLSPDAAASAQSEALKTMLELQAAEAQWMGGEAKDRYPDAQYAMACMADELFTHMEWDGQAAWRNHLLEVKLFKSHAADVELFKRIDKLLKESPDSPVARDLARVYLLVLAAGFQGKYRPFGLPRALAQYRQRLYEYIHAGDSLMLYAPDRKIFPEAAARTLEGHAVGRFSSLQRWAAILVFLVLGYTVLAHYAWNRVSADLRDVTERIRAASSTAGSSTSPTSSTSATANGGGR